MRQMRRAIAAHALDGAQTFIEEAMMSNTRAATTAAAKPLEFQVMSGSFALVGNQPANYTLATGETEALLVDVPFSRSDAHRVVAAILDSGRKLTTIFVTHDHPDHFFSLDLLIDSFPNARIVVSRRQGYGAVDSTQVSALGRGHRRQRTAPRGGSDRSSGGRNYA
jgi:glyoxylase-like metal-dependent hydrolase (beta-lactamase superfamily II)